MQRESFKHIFDENVRWGDCDMLGHVNNATYLRYIESARVAYIQDVMKLELTNDSERGWVIVDLHCRFTAQLKYPAKIQTGTAVTHIGNSSAKIDAAVFLLDGEAPVFTSTATIVWCNLLEGKSMRIPNELRHIISGYEKL